MTPFDLRASVEIKDGGAMPNPRRRRVTLYNVRPENIPMLKSFEGDRLTDREQMDCRRLISGYLRFKRAAYGRRSTDH